MFLYSFLAMTAYNIIRPLARVQFIEDLGADNLPYVQFATGMLIGFVMQWYTRIVGLLPRTSVIPATQVGMAGLLAVFWALFVAGQAWASISFYFVALILGLLLISQFWTLANDIYDARQAKRLFGFIGGGASLGGVVGSAILAFTVAQIGPNHMLLVSAAILLVSAFVVALVIRDADIDPSRLSTVVAEDGVGGQEAIRLLRGSRHLQVIALIIALAAVGAGLLEQQLNMAVEEMTSSTGAIGMAEFLGQVQLYVSLVGFVIQIWLTSRIHRYFGIGFALLILPVFLGMSSILTLATGTLWAVALGRTVDASLRYTVDKTTREILFLPLSPEVKHRAKPFLDVTVDRFAKAIGALVILVLIKPWGFGLTWRQLGFMGLLLTAAWLVSAVYARRGYMAAFRQTIVEQGVQPAELRIDTADLSTVETLLEELAHPEETRVLYAIEMLESLDKRNLITPLLLQHTAPAVRAKALTALRWARPDLAARWMPRVREMIGDSSADVRAAALAALAAIQGENATALARSLLDESDPRIVVTAAVALANSADPADRAAAERALVAVASGARESASEVRCDLAAAIRQVNDSGSRELLIPLLHDPDPRVAEEAMRTVRALKPPDVMFAPTLVSLLGNRRLKGAARATLVRFGERVVDVLGYFLHDPDENIWVRRHIPGTLAQIPCQKSMDLLTGALSEEDGFLRFKVLSAIEKLRREHEDLVFVAAPIERLALKESLKYFNWLGLYYNLFVRAGLSDETVLAVLLKEKMARTVDRIYRLLGVLYSWHDVSAARRAVEHGDRQSRAGALEYLDNVLSSELRHRILRVLEDSPIEDKVQHGNALLRTRPRDVEETMLQLINDDDQVVAATAIDVVRELELWALAPDLEHVLAHRDPSHWFVFEAASWTLAARRVGFERRRALWMEPLPAAALVKRLRRLPMFASVAIDELFRFAGAGHQIRHETGATLLRDGTVPDSLHILLDGAVVAGGRTGAARELTAPATVGFEEVLDGALMTETVRTVAPTVSLALSNEEMLTLLADNARLVEGFFRTLLTEHSNGRQSFILRGQDDGDDLAHPEGGSLTPIQKVLALQRVPVFSRLSAAEIRHLASIARQVRLEPGASPSDDMAEGTVTLVLSGQVTVEAGDRADAYPCAGPGDTVGLYQAMAGGGVSSPAHALRLVATRPGWALLIDRDDLFELLGERPEFLQQMFAALFGRMSDPRPTVPA